MAALEKMFTFLQGQPYRLILFGGRQEVFVDDVTQLPQQRPVDRLLLRLREGARADGRTYPKGTEFRMILLTDAILDPDPEDWKDMDVPPGVDLKAHVVERTARARGAS